jgi:hypothetical protein
MEVRVLLPPLVILLDGTTSLCAISDVIPRFANAELLRKFLDRHQAPEHVEIYHMRRRSKDSIQGATSQEQLYFLQVRVFSYVFAEVAKN